MELLAQVREQEVLPVWHASEICANSIAQGGLVFSEPAVATSTSDERSRITGEKLVPKRVMKAHPRVVAIWTGTNFGFRVSNFEFPISSFQFRISSFECPSL
jgi:hypothetical protein